MKNPEQFQRVAREWSIKHANAPAATSWEATLAHAPTSSKPKQQKVMSREEMMRMEAARCALVTQKLKESTNLKADTKDTTRTSSTVSLTWALTSTELWKLSSLSILTRTAEMTMSWRKLIWVI